MSFFVRRGNQEYGPYTEADLRSYVTAGSILPGELARAEGSTQYTAVASILAQAATGVPSAPPPPFTQAGPIPPGQYLQYGRAQVPVQAQQKERTAYILLGIFLGCFGVHNFYAGYTGRAIAQLLITLLTLFIGSFISAIWAIVEVCTVTVDASGVPFK